MIFKNEKKKGEKSDILVSILIHKMIRMEISVHDGKCEYIIENEYKKIPIRFFFLDLVRNKRLSQNG